MIHYSHFAIRWCIKLFHLRLIYGKNYCVGIIPKSHFAILDGAETYFSQLRIIHRKKDCIENSPKIKKYKQNTSMSNQEITQPFQVSG